MNCMTAKPFVDTNVLIYGYDKTAGSRHQAAAALLRCLWQRGGGSLSTQVLQEFYVNVTRKIPQPLTAARARGILRDYCAWHIEPISCETVLQASDVQERNQLSFWDALIVAAATRSGADLLLSEDLNAGQIVEGVRIVSPFFDTDPYLRELLESCG